MLFISIYKANKLLTLKYVKHERLLNANSNCIVYLLAIFWSSRMGCRNSPTYTWNFLYEKG